MHEFHRTTVFEPRGSGIEGDDRYVSLLDVSRFVRRWRRTIVRVTLIFIGVAAAYAFLTQPLFTAMAQVMLEPSQARDTLDDATRPVIAVDQARVESHIEIIKSAQLALNVIHNLKLTDLPEFHAPRGEKDTDGYAVLIFSQHLTVRRIGQSLVIEVSFRFRDPALAASITNALADAYIVHEMTVKSDAIKHAESWLYDKQASFEDQTRAVVAEIKKYDDQPEATPGRAGKLEELRDRAQIYQRMHDAYIQKFNEAIQKAAFPEPDARIISLATVPLRKSYPKRTLIIALGGLLGLGLGVILSFARQSLDRTIRLPSQLTGMADCFGTVGPFPPRAKVTRANPVTRRARHQAAARDPVLHFVAENPASAVAREFRNIKVVVDCAMDARKSPLIGIVAATRREGATTIAANLATVYSTCGQRTLLVDLCDENPRLTRDFPGIVENPNPARGLVDLAKSAQSGERHGARPGPNVRRDGPTLRVQHIDGRSDGDDGTRDFDALRQSYDAIIVDLPGLAHSADARAIARCLDAVIVVVQAGSTSIDAVQSAVEALQMARAPIIGIVLNKATMR
ncbi:MAG TPA: Wzz/FepE/Etk N-terminal domain-containing protein [Xanthobacteraceae bacterium]|jgi:Mrp family chromosome partitioning ATPase/capsular polysaccharide biosynthesis protein